MNKKEKKSLFEDLTNQYTALSCMFVLTDDKLMKRCIVVLVKHVWAQLYKVLSTPTFASGGYIHKQQGEEAVIVNNTSMKVPKISFA